MTKVIIGKMLVFRLDSKSKNEEELKMNMAICGKTRELKAIGFEISIEQYMDERYCWREYSVMFNSDEEATIFKLTYL